MPAKPELAPPDIYKSRPISLQVGQAAVEFFVHTDILNAKTSYWTEKLSDTPPKGDPDWYWVPADTLRLDDEPAIVGLFLDFIYARPPAYAVIDKPRVFIDAKLYCFGAKYGVESLQKYAHNEIFKFLDADTTASILSLPKRLELIERVYNHTNNDTDELRLLLAEDFARRWEEYKKPSSKGGRIDHGSKLGRTLRAVPAFKDDLLSCLGDSKKPKLPQPPPPPGT